MTKDILVEFKSVSKHFDNRTLLDNINFTLTKGEITTLIGQNGVGKTTIARIILGLEEVAKGQVILRDNLKIGYVPQKLDFFFNMPLTCEGLMDMLAVNKLSNEVLSLTKFINYEKIRKTDIKKLHSLLDNFNKKYITNLFTHEKSSIKQISLTAINTLSQEKDLLDLLNTLQQQNLIDAVKIHTSHNKSNEYPSNIHDILSLLETTLKNKSDIISQEKQHLVKMACNIIQAIQEIYSLSDDKNQLQLLENHLALLQSTNIAFSIPNLNLELQLNLIDNLLMIKELWFIKQDHHIFKKDIRVKLNQDTNNTIKLKDYENIAVIFTKIINVLSNDDNILEELTNTEIINLYGKLKNVVSISQTEIIILLNKLHLEAKTRYNCNKLDDSGYQLLKLFQPFDIVINQINTLETNILESYLFRPNQFAQELTLYVIKHLDNIKALSLNKNINIITVINDINSKLLNSGNNNLNLLSKLNIPLESHVQKRYAELDPYNIIFLQNSYITLFNQIKSLLSEKTNKDLVQNMLIKKFANDYYLTDFYNSSVKLKLINKQRKKIFQALSSINFVDIFYTNYPHKITSLDFNKKLSDSNINSPTAYITLLLEEILVMCNSFQLESLYKPLMQNKLSATQIILKEQIIKQIHQRTNIRKMFFSIISGKKDEYNTLRTIRKEMKKNSSIVK